MKKKTESNDLVLVPESSPLSFFLNLDLFNKNLKKTKKLQGVRSDVKHIACEACEALARHAASHVSQMREEKKKEITTKDDENAASSSSSSSKSSPASRFKKAPLAKGTLTEAEILDAVEGMADLNTPSGEWISHFDFEIVSNGGKTLKLKNMGERGKCGTRCRTLAMAVADSLEGTDTDLAERLWRGGEEAGPSEVTKWLCQEATSACRSSSSPPPPLPAARAAALAREISDLSPFEPESAEDAQLRTMMASMKQQGMGGQMFSRENVMKSLKDDDDDDDDEEEVNEEAKRKAEGQARTKEALDAAIKAEEEARKAPSSPSDSFASSSSSSDFSERAERAKAAAKEGIAAAKGWFSEKKKSLFGSSASSQESTAEL